MIIAQKKRKENIIEYLLYMWQVEDLIRANGLDMKRIEATVVDRYGNVDEAQRRQIYDWWDNLTEMMRIEKCETSGHLQVTRGLMNDIYNFHLYLLTKPEEAAYQNAFQTAWSDLLALKARIPDGDRMQHVELALTAIYDYFLLKLQGRTVLADTTNAVVRISRAMAILSARYLEAERELDKRPQTNADGTLSAAR